MSGSSKSKFGARASASIVGRPQARSGIGVGGIMYFECWRPYGPALEAAVRGDRVQVKAFLADDHAFHRRVWADSGKNIVTDVGLNHILDILFVSATTQVDPFHVGLTDATPTVAAGDTMAVHAGWVEDQNYTEGTRVIFVDVRTGQTVDNSASKASFAINATTTIGGAFMAENSAKGSTTLLLLCVVAFTGGDKAVANNDTLEVQYDFSAADA